MYVFYTEIVKLFTDVPCVPITWPCFGNLFFMYTIFPFFCFMAQQSLSLCDIGISSIL